MFSPLGACGAEAENGIDEGSEVLTGLSKIKARDGGKIITLLWYLGLFEAAASSVAFVLGLASAVALRKRLTPLLRLSLLFLLATILLYLFGTALYYAGLSDVIL